MSTLVINTYPYLIIHCFYKKQISCLVFFLDANSTELDPDKASCGESVVTFRSEIRFVFTWKVH